jgi:SAM-dependent methyltransferase
MVHLFRKRDGQEGPPLEGGDGSLLASHILTKFLKRLRAMPRPYLLDLGRLSGANIEFFAQAGCKVQVEDLLFLAEPGESATEVTAVHEAGDPARGATGQGDPPGSQGAAPVLEAAPATGIAPAPGAAIGPAPSHAANDPAGRTPAGPGQRPSRRIVLPQRTFPKTSLIRRDVPEAVRSGVSRGSTGSLAPAGAGRGPAWRCGLPVNFAYGDETFDAVVAWDIFNYYDPESVLAVAAETRRVLKPGGLILSYFHARRREEPHVPPRYHILDEKRVSCGAGLGRELPRQVYQNRDIEKMFLGLRIVELYFLKNSIREILMEKKTISPSLAKPLVRAAEPKPRFTIE